MAKRHHKRRRYGGLMRVGFGFSNPLSKLPASVSTKDLAVGAGAGILTALVSRYAFNNFAPASLQTQATATNADGSMANPVIAFIYDNLPAVGSVIAGLGLYFAQRKKNLTKAGSHLVGALLVGGAYGGLAALQTAFPTFKGLQIVKLGRGQFKALVLRDQDRAAMKGFGAIVLPVRSAPSTPAAMPATFGRRPQLRGVVLPIGARRPG